MFILVPPESLRTSTEDSSSRRLLLVVLGRILGGGNVDHCDVCERVKKLEKEWTEDERGRTRRTNECEREND
jgi:hypothetical protein